MPVMGLFVYQLAAVALGIARRALDDLAEMAQNKVPTMYTSSLADKAVVQVEMARAEAALGAARAYLYGVVDDLWQTVCAAREPSARQVALGRLAGTQAVETAASVARTAGTLAGGSAIYDSSPMQRHWRDAEAITHHFTVAPHIWEEGGRVLLGRPTIVPAF
jgi:alkylation response protein AidB-like acyl-CoA dehydrogenase